MALNLILKTVLIYGQSFIILPIYSSGSTILVCPAFGLSEPGVIVQNIFWQTHYCLLYTSDAADEL